MGQAKPRLSRFKDKHPRCVFCGGAYETETIDHAPPRIFFVNKRRPSGGEVPACGFCNRRHSDFDLLAGFLLQLMASHDGRKVDETLKKQIGSVAARFPETVKDLLKNAQKGWLQKNGLLRSVTHISFESSEIHFAMNYAAAREPLKNLPISA